MSGLTSAALASILLASLLGSPHCAAMCGGFAALVGGSSEKRISARIISYHAGRLVAYLIAGAGASSLSAVTEPVWIGTGLVIIGLASLATVRAIPQSLHRAMTVGYRKIIAWVPRNSPAFPLAVGLGSAFLPCGWLYVYVALAAANKSPFLTMTLFWAGTIPILTAWSAASGWALLRFGRYFPSCRAALLICAGIFSIVQHTHITSSPSPSCGHHVHAE